MSDAIETIEESGYVASIHYDESQSGPDDWDTFGILAFDTRHASVNADDLPSDRYGTGRWEVDCEPCFGTGMFESNDGSGYVGECERCAGNGYVTDAERACRDMHGAVAVLPVYAYDDRMGTVVEIADDWDRANGWIYATQATADMTGVPADAYLAALESELGAWNQYLQGDVYGYIVKDPSGNEVESCWGFYGMDDVIAEARSVLESLPAVRILREHPGASNLIVN